MAKRTRNRLGGFGASDTDHLSIGRRHVEEAWNDLERMPPTCEGGISVASRALASAERARAHLAAIDNSVTRAAHNDLYALVNRAGFAADKTLNFFSQVCKAPYSDTKKVPLFNRRTPIDHRKGKR